MLPLRVNPAQLFTTYDSVKKAGRFLKITAITSCCDTRFYPTAHVILTAVIPTDYVIPTAKFSLSFKLGSAFFCTCTS